MRYLFNNRSYPIVHSPEVEDIVVLLKNPTVKAVVYRSPASSATLEIFKNGITAPNTEIAQKYTVQKGQEDREIAAGRVMYFDTYTEQQISQEAHEGGIEITQTALNALTTCANDIRILFTRIYQAYANDSTSKIAGNILFTPKGGDGRAPQIHADFLSLAGHFAAALSPLDIMSKEPDQTLWDAINRKKQNCLSPEDRATIAAWLSQMAIEKQDDFFYSTIGDLLITKGQRFVDLDTREGQAQVCVHKSSALIPQLGQATVLFYPRVPK